MTNALKDLNEMVARIRAEAYASGYAHALKDVARMVEGFPIPHEPEKRAVSSEKVPEPTAESLRTPRGHNKFRITRALKLNPERQSILEIKKLAERDGEGEMPYSSVQQALDQLEKAGLVSRTEKRGEWYGHPELFADRDGGEFV